MFSTRFRLSRYPLRLTLLALAGVCTLSQLARADDGFRYFSDPEIDFWGRREAPTKIPASPPSAKQPPSPPTKGFAWDKYLSPAHDDFFREGDYTPPAPFVEIARNPTDENIERWYRYIELKNDVLKRLQTRLGEFAQKNPDKVGALPAPFANGLADDPETMARMAARVPKLVSVTPDAKRFRLRMYFDSHCPHCERMMGTLSELAARGYFVELRQVDKDRSTRSRIPFPVADATPEELKTYGVEAVPVLLVGDLKNKSFFKMQGYQTVPAVLAGLQESQ